jgi:HSP90 family molecular chaperone
MISVLLFLLALLSYSNVVISFKYPRLTKWSIPGHSCTKFYQNQFRTSPNLQMTAESYNFESNVSRVMNIIINSLYSNKDVFLRELVSNAADACDKKRFYSLTSHGTDEQLEIKITTDRNSNTLTIADNGIGMSKQDLINNLGRIAESGTQRFMDSVGKDKKELNQIGQFGVGFYSGFLVANKMTVISKKEGTDQYRWEAESNKLNSYTIEADNSEPIESSSGTKIILHLKDECDQYCDDVTIRELLTKYSEFISFPILLQKNVTRPEEVPDTTVLSDTNAASATEDGSQTIPMKTVMKTELEWEQVNEKRPLWLRRPKDCTAEEYSNFYKQTFKAYDEPLSQSHFSIEGNVDFKALIYIPSEVPYDLMRDMFASNAKSLRLYVKRVFINDNFEDLMPRWLLFIRGVIDSDDLPLNVGREILQQSRTLRIIKQRLVKKSIDMFTDLALTNETAYNKFWKNFGRYLKVGVIEDSTVRDELIPLCRFHTSYSKTDVENPSGNKQTSLQDYVSRMKEGQNNIYYVVGETLAQAAMSPAIEKIKQKGYEVIYVSEAIDEMTLQSVEKYMNKPIMDVSKEASEASELSPNEKKEKEILNEDFGPLRDRMKSILGNKVTRVEVSTRLVDSPVALVQGEYGVSPTMQKYLRAQAVAQNDDLKADQFDNLYNQAVLEINPSHSIIKNLKSLMDSQQDEDSMKEMVRMLFDTAALSAGYVLENASAYAQMVTKILTRLST